MAAVLVDKVMGLASPDGEAKLVREITDSGFRRALQDGVKHDPASCGVALEAMDMTQHSIGYLELLHVMSDIPELSANFMTQVREFFTVCNPRQVQLMPERFADVVTKFVAVHLKAKGSPLSAVGPLLSAVQKVRRSPEHLSGVHHEFVKMCLLAKCYHIAARVLDDDVLYLPEQDGGKVPELKIEHVLMYHYYGGMVYVGLKKLERALQFFSVAITAPAECTSQIMLEAYKKYMLVCLLMYGKDVPLPSYASSLTRQFKNQLAPYTDVVAAYRKGEADGLDAAVVKHANTFTSDSNVGLVRQCKAKLSRRNIKRLTETFLTLSLDDIAKRVKLVDGAAAEVALVGMIADGEIFATINQLTGTVSFHDDPEDFTTFATTQQLQQETSEAAELYTKVMALDTELRMTPKYIKKTNQTSSNSNSMSTEGMGELDGLDGSM